MKNLSISLLLVLMAVVGITQHVTTTAILNHDQMLRGHEADITNLQTGRRVGMPKHVTPATPRPLLPPALSEN